MAWAKRLARKFFFARVAIVSAGQNIIFRDNKRYKQRLGPPVPKRRQFSDLFSRARVSLKERKTTEKETWHQSRHDSLHCPRVKCNKFWQKDTGKTKQKTTSSVSTFKGKRKFLRFEIVKFKTPAFNRKIEIKPILFVLNSLTANNHFWCCCPLFASELMHNSTGYVIKQLVHTFSGALSCYGAAGKFGEHSRS